MGIKIGDKNRINNSIISNGSIVTTEKGKDGFLKQHPVFSTIIAGIIVGVILMFSFWEKIVQLIESL